MSGGCEWEPFEIAEREYAELVSALQQSGDYRALPKPPAWVGSERDWGIWLDEYDRGVPAEEHRRLQAEADAAYRAYLDSWEEAVQKRDPMLPVRRWHISLSASRSLADLQAGKPIGSTHKAMDTPLDRAAGRASDGQTALMAAERIGDERLIEHWRRELAVADEALESVVPDEASAAAAKALANATERRG